MTDVNTFKIKTYNPFQLIFILVGSVVLSLWLFNSYDETSTILFGSIISILALTLSNYFLGKYIEVQLTEKGIETNWAIPPFFNKTYQKVLWTDIVSWNFESWRMADTFYIKTSDGQKLYIRCFKLFKRQEHLDDFLQVFQKYSNNTAATKKKSFLTTPIGIIFTIIYFIILIVYVVIKFKK